MKLYQSKYFSDQEVYNPKETKFAVVYSSKEELKQICDFFAEVKKHISSNDNCHMHLRDHFKNWDIKKHIDIEVNID